MAGRGSRLTLRLTTRRVRPMLWLVKVSKRAPWCSLHRKAKQNPRAIGTQEYPGSAILCISLCNRRDARALSEDLVDIVHPTVVGYEKAASKNWIWTGERRQPEA